MAHVFPLGGQGWGTGGDNPPAGGSSVSRGMLGLGLPAPIPPVPRQELERIWGRVHISTYCRREAEREYTAWLECSDYTFHVPETDGEGYLLTAAEVGTCNLQSLMALAPACSLTKKPSSWSLIMPPDALY